MDAYIQRKELARELVSIIRLVKKPRIYLANDVVGGYGGSWIAKLAGSDSELVLVNQLATEDWYSIMKQSRDSYFKISSGDSGYMVQVRIPFGSSFSFRGVPPNRLHRFISDRRITRNRRMSYYFPELETKLRTYEDLGHEMVVWITDSPVKSSLIYFDTSSKSHKFGW